MPLVFYSLTTISTITVILWDVVQALRIEERINRVKVETGRGANMLNSFNGRQELDRVNMFIRALSAEMAQTQAGVESSFPNAAAIEMQEALYELRLRKLFISALVDSDRVADNTASH